MHSQKQDTAVVCSNLTIPKTDWPCCWTIRQTSVAPCTTPLQQTEENGWCDCGCRCGRWQDDDSHQRYKYFMKQSWIRFGWVRSDDEIW